MGALVARFIPDSSPPPHNDTQHYTCRNHIRFYHPVPEVRSTASPKSLIVCGTGAFYPNCTIMEDVSLGTSNHFLNHFGQLFCTPHMTMNPLTILGQVCVCVPFWGNLMKCTFNNSYLLTYKGISGWSYLPLMSIVLVL